MRFFIFLTLLVCSAGQIKAEEYVNDAYGIHVRTSGGWKILNSAKLQIDLRTLDDDQLAELFDAYDDFGVVGLDNRKDAKIPRVRIHMYFPRGRFFSALELAERYSSTGSARTIAVPASEMTIGEVEGAYTAVRAAGSNRPAILHHFIVQRARSYVVVTAVFPDGNLEEQLTTIRTALSDWQIDLQADQRN